MTAATFLTLYPEFSTATTALIELKIAEAELQTSDTWGDRRDPIILALTTAALLADAVQGRNARLDPGKGRRNIYAERLKTEREAHAALLNRIG